MSKLSVIIPLRDNGNTDFALRLSWRNAYVGCYDISI